MTLRLEDLTAMMCHRIGEAAPCLLAQYLVPRPVRGFVLDGFLPVGAPHAGDELLAEALHQPAVMRALAAALALPQDLHGGPAQLSSLRPGRGMDPLRTASHGGANGAARVLDLHFCTATAWREEEGGHFEIWQLPPEGTVWPVKYRENRLVGVAAGEEVWVGVSPVMGKRARTAVSVSCFSAQVSALHYAEQVQAKPEQRIRSLLLRGNHMLRRVLPGRDRG